MAEHSRDMAEQSRAWRERTWRSTHVTWRSVSGVTSHAAQRHPPPRLRGDEADLTAHLFPTLIEDADAGHPPDVEGDWLKRRGLTPWGTVGVLEHARRAAAGWTTIHPSKGGSCHPRSPVSRQPSADWSTSHHNRSAAKSPRKASTSPTWTRVIPCSAASSCRRWVGTWRLMNAKRLMSFSLLSLGKSREGTAGVEPASAQSAEDHSTLPWHVTLRGPPAATLGFPPEVASLLLSSLAVVA